VPGARPMEFLMLGCLEVRSGDTQLSLGKPREQRLLAALLLDAGRVVPLSRLADMMWPENPPAGAGKQIRNSVSRLRAVFAGAGASDLIVTHSSGYRLAVAADAVDALQFAAQVAQAQRAASAGQLREAAGLLGAALGLWRGPLLAGLGGAVIGAAAAAWEEQRYAAAEAFYDYQLTLGRHGETVAELKAFAAENPLREKPARQLIVALYRCGRQADALACYERTRALLADELGLDPSQELQRLRQQVLTDDPAIAAPPPAAPPPAAEEPAARPLRQADGMIPRQLPATPAIFVGRELELARLGDLLAPGQGARAVAVSGMAGVGKTTLAVQWAQENSALFPDGTLYVDLRGYAPGGKPLTPAAALDGLLRGLDVANDRIPYDLAERSALFRTVTAQRRVLIVLDNARSAAQVRPLLPGAGSARTIVTSRNRLSGLIVREGLIPLYLDVLPPPAAARLLQLASGLVVSDTDATELAELCGRLPLALAVAAERITHDQAADVRRTLTELADPRTRLDILDVEDDEAATVRRVLAWSYEALPTTAQQVLRSLSQVSLADIDVPAATALTGLDLVSTRRLLDRLVSGYLLVLSGGRYSLHDLIRSFAGERSAQEDGDDDRESAVARLTGWYLHSACNARVALAPQLPALVAAAPAPSLPPASFSSAQEALAWCEVERANLVIVGQVAFDHGLDAVAWQLPTALYGFFELRKYWNDWIETHTVALEAARRIGDHEAEGRIWCNLGNAYRPLYQFDNAISCYRKALVLFDQVGYRQGEAKVLGNLGTTLYEMGELSESVAHHEQALARFEAIGDSYGRALTLTNLGDSYRAAGQLPQAARAHEEALRLFRLLGDQDGQARAMSNMGKVLAAAGQHSSALHWHHQATQLFQASGNSLDQAYTLADMMVAHFAVGELELADADGRRAADQLAQLGHDAARGQVLTDLAIIRDFAGDQAGAAESRHEAALARGRVSPAQQEAARRVAAALVAPLP
jgi:DNA-binding SARP family transcriptional activator/Tfp pilus assembly protein PilF